MREELNELNEKCTKLLDEKNRIRIDYESVIDMLKDKEIEELKARLAEYENQVPKAVYKEKVKKSDNTTKEKKVNKEVANAWEYLKCI